MRSTTTCALLALAFGASCGTRDEPFDTPPPSAPRASVEVVVDLARSAGCEQAFDLALYRHRGVDLVAWRPDGSSRCARRAATVRYFPARIARAELVEAIRRASVKMEVVD